MGRDGVFGGPPRGLVEWPPDAAQLSPLVPGGTDLATLEPGALRGIVMLAPPGTLERRYAMAQALRVLAPGQPLVVLARKDKGGRRVAKELADFGCEVSDTSKAHYRIASCKRPAEVRGIAEAIAAGGPQFVEATGMWSEPGVFSWDRIDAGSQLLTECMPPLQGRGADLGCGYGYLARCVLASPTVTALLLVDVDRRAIEAARRNIPDPRASFVWADVRSIGLDARSLDFVVMNPPFHDGGSEDKALGQAFILRAAEILRRGGSCWLTANRHLPYEAVLKAHFSTVRLVSEHAGYKVFEAIA